MAHISHEELAKRLAEAGQLVEVGARYRHYRNPESAYTVLSIGLQEESEEVCVVYKTSHPSGLVWVRNLDDWLATVTDSDGRTVPRFVRIAG